MSWGGDSDAREIDLRQEYRTATPPASTAKAGGRLGGLGAAARSGRSQGDIYTAQRAAGPLCLLRWRHGIRAGRGLPGDPLVKVVC